MLSKDIKITHTSGYYDRILENNNLKTITGINCLKQACDLKLNTRYGEIQNPTYKEWGNHAWEAMKENNINLARIMVKESFRSALTEINGISTVNYLEVEFDKTPPGGIHVTYIVTGTDGTEISNRIGV